MKKIDDNIDSSFNPEIISSSWIRYLRSKSPTRTARRRKAFSKCAKIISEFLVDRAISLSIFK